MILINSDTNLLVAGVPVPCGQLDLPYEGLITFSGSQFTTNLSVSSGDTVIAWNGGIQLYNGVEVWAMFLLGVWLVVGVFGLMAAGRKLIGMMGGAWRKEV